MLALLSLRVHDDHAGILNTSGSVLQLVCVLCFVSSADRSSGLGQEQDTQFLCLNMGWEGDSAGQTDIRYVTT